MSWCSSLITIPQDAPKTLNLVSDAARIAKDKSCCKMYFIPKFYVGAAIILNTFNAPLYVIKGATEFVSRFSNINSKEAIEAFKALGRNLWNAVKSVIIVVVLIIFLVISIFWGRIFQYWPETVIKKSELEVAQEVAVKAKEAAAAAEARAAAAATAKIHHKKKPQTDTGTTIIHPEELTPEQLAEQLEKTQHELEKMITRYNAATAAYGDMSGQLETIKIELESTKTRNQELQKEQTQKTVGKTSQLETELFAQKLKHETLEREHSTLRLEFERQKTTFEPLLKTELTAAVSLSTNIARIKDITKLAETAAAFIESEKKSKVDVSSEGEQKAKTDKATAIDNKLRSARKVGDLLDHLQLEIVLREFIKIKQQQVLPSSTSTPTRPTTSSRLPVPTTGTPSKLVFGSPDIRAVSPTRTGPSPSPTPALTPIPTAHITAASPPPHSPPTTPVAPPVKPAPTTHPTHTPTPAATPASTPAKTTPAATTTPTATTAATTTTTTPATAAATPTPAKTQPQAAATTNTSPPAKTV